MDLSLFYCERILLFHLLECSTCVDQMEILLLPFEGCLKVGGGGRSPAFQKEH